MKHFYRLWLGLSIGIALFALPAWGQTISITSLSATGPFCGGDNFSVNFGVDAGGFGATQTINAELSDDAGVFAATPPVIGTLSLAAATITGSVSVVAPTPTTTGSGYIIRLVAVGVPSATSNNSAQFTIRADLGTVTITGPSTACQNVSTSFRVNAPNAVSLTYANTLGSFTAPGDAIFTSTGTAVLSVTPTGCGTATAGTWSVNVQGDVGTATITGPDPVCSNVSTAYTASALNATGFTYSTDNGTIDASGNATFTTAGTATITATPSGCGTLTAASKTITVSADVGTVTITGPTSACTGGTTSYTVSAPNATSLTYSSNNGSFVAPGDAVFATAGSAVLTVTPAGCGTLTPGTLNVTVLGNIGTVTVTGPDPVCTNVSYAYSASATNATGFTYSNSNGTIDASGNATFTTAGSATITATPLGCGSATGGTKTVTVQGDVGPVTVGGPGTACIGVPTSFAATATNATGMTYSTSGGSIDGSGTATFTAAGGVTITATPSGCGTLTAGTKSVNVIGDVGPVNLTGPLTACTAPSTFTYTATAANATGFTYGTSNGSISSSGVATFASPGAATITATPLGCGTLTPATLGVTVNDNVTTPVFAKGGSSTRCASTTSDTYTASASNSAPLVYTVDALSAANGVSVNASGVVTFSTTYTGPTTITATASGCNPGTTQASHTVTVAGNVTFPALVVPPVTSRCQGVGPVNYSITATNSTSYTYSISDPSAGSFGTGPNAGVFTFLGGYSGTVVVTASANGCAGPLSTTVTTVVTSSVSTPLFLLGPNSGRCQGAGNATYIATAANSSAITYSLSPAAAGTINTTSGVVTYLPAFAGPTATITASAAGCNGPATAQHNVTFTPLVGKPVFALGATSTLCQNPQIVTYTATASDGTITYSATPAASIPYGMDTTNGQYIYPPTFYGTLVVKALARGCNGSRDSSIHTVTVHPTPIITASIPRQTLCAGASTAVVGLSSSAPSTQYAWVNSNPSVGGGTSGTTTTSLSSFVTSNPGLSLDSTIFTITPTANGCQGNSITSVVRVVPTPVVSPLTPGLEYCHGVTTDSIIHFTSAIVGLPVTYTWTNSNPSMGLSASGNNNIPLFTPNNLTNLPVVANISATPTIAITGATCTGVSTPVGKITIKPAPRVIASIPNLYPICSGAPLNFTVSSSIPDSVGTTTYAWTRDAMAELTNKKKDSISGNLVSDTLTTSTLTPVNVVYTFDLATNGCVYKDQPLTVVVNPTPPVPGSPKLSLPIEKICAGLQQLNLETENTPSAVEFYQWSGPAGTQIIQKTDSTASNHALVSFLTPNQNQDFTTISVFSVVRGFNCPSKESKANFKVEQASMPQVTVGTISNNLVAQVNVSTGEKTRFQWGYDTRAGLTGNKIDGATDQFYWTNNPNAPHKFDPAMNMYWVMVTFNDDCTQKAYFNGPSPLSVSAPEMPLVQLELFPNPVKEVLTVECQAANMSNMRLELNDLSGRHLGSYPVTGSRTRIPLSELAPGYYVLQCIQDGRRVAYGRFIKQ